MKTSAFAQGGLFRFSSRPSYGEAIYRAMRVTVGDSFAEGGHADAGLFARAMGMGRAQLMLERASKQRLPRYVSDMLEAYEKQYGIVPRKGATLRQRRERLAERIERGEAGTRGAIEMALRRALGSDFIAYRTRSQTPAYRDAAETQTPLMPQNGPGLFAPRSRVRKVGRLARDMVGRMDANGQWQKVEMHVEPLPGLASSCSFAEGDVVVVSPDFGGSAERLTLTTPPPTQAELAAMARAAAEEAKAAVARALAALLGQPEPESIPAFVYPQIPRFHFPPGGMEQSPGPFGVYARKGHAKGAVVTVQHWPYWVGHGRRSAIVVSARAARDPLARAEIDRVMRTHARAVSMWDIVTSDSIFVLGRSTLGTTTL